MNIGSPAIFAAGISGDVISFLVFLAPIPTFYKIYKERSTKEYDSLPYSVALFSSTMWLIYGLFTKDIWLMSINSFGCIIESVYLLIYLIYAPRKPKIRTLALVVGFNMGLLGAFVVLTVLLAEGNKRATILGWAGSAFALCVFVAPLSVIRLVIKTKSARYMPILLSFFLTLNAVAWLTYGLLKKDMYVAVPNIVGLLFGIVQMVLYKIYGNGEKATANEGEKHAMQSSLVDKEVELMADRNLDGV